MTENQLFQQLDFYRFLTLAVLDTVDEQTADVMPAGFNNSIRWNLGHIYVAHENIAFGAAGLQRNIPDGYRDWFEGGTKPADWTATPPTLAEIRAHLTEQPDRTRQYLSGRLETAVAQPFVFPNGVQLTTVGEALNFALYHEGQHTGYIKAMLKAVKG